MHNFAIEALGIGSIVGQSLSVKALTEIDGKTPILFIVSIGYDPTKELEEWAEKDIGRENFIQISMGGGQSNTILSEITRASETGKWICLKNLHLVISFLPAL